MNTLFTWDGIATTITLFMIGVTIATTRLPHDKPMPTNQAATEYICPADVRRAIDTGRQELRQAYPANNRQQTIKKVSPMYGDIERSQ